MDFHPLLAFLVALVISSVMSVGGISGAFLLLPFQVSVLGFTGPGVTPTNHLFNVVAIPSGVYRFFREGRMLWSLALVISVATVPGVIIGSLARVHLLSDPRHFKMLVGCVLLGIGVRMAFKVLRKDGTPRPEEPGESKVEDVTLGIRKLEYSFSGKRYTLPVPQVLVITGIIGIISGAYGIGGGAIIAPLLVSLWGLPVHTIAGAALFGTFLTSASGVAFFMLLGRDVWPDWTLGLSFGAGGLVGIYLGARLQKFLPARPIEGLLTLVVSGLGLSYVVGFILSR